MNGGWFDYQPDRRKRRRVQHITVRHHKKVVEREDDTLVVAQRRASVILMDPEVVCLRVRVREELMMAVRRCRVVYMLGRRQWQRGETESQPG